MKINKKATSIVESMVVMMIIVSWVTGMYHIYGKSTDLSYSTSNKIQAIQIAKQWIEAFTSMRDTNWILFSSDYTNCWNVVWYNDSCIWDSSSTNKIDHNGLYKIYRNDDNIWRVEQQYTTTNVPAYWDSSYLSAFEVWYDWLWIYNQTGSLSNLTPLFTREIQTQYIANNWVAVDNPSLPRLKIISKVQWIDNTSSQPHSVEMEQILTNWKDN